MPLDAVKVVVEPGHTEAAPEIEAVQVGVQAGIVTVTLQVVVLPFESVTVNVIVCVVAVVVAVTTVPAAGDCVTV